MLNFGVSQNDMAPTKNQPALPRKKTLTPSPEIEHSPWSNDGWKTILSYWEGNFSGANS